MILRDPLPTDAAVASSPTPDAKQPEAPSSGAVVDAKEPEKSFDELASAAVVAKLDTAKETVQAKPSIAEPAPAEQAPLGDVSNLNKTEKPKAGEFDDLPFHQHERFQQVVKERKEFKESLEQSKPAIERLKTIDDFCQGNRITPQQFKDVLEIQALLNTNPAEALKRLQPTIDRLHQYQGTTLSPDLQEAVESGKLPLEYAQRLAAAENQRKFVEQSTAQNALHARDEVLFNTLSSWERQTFQTDPDYARKQQAVIDRFVSLSAKEPWRTPDQALALVQKAYNDVNSFVSGFVPKPAPTKVLQSNGSSAASIAEPDSWDKVEDFVVNRHATRR